MLKHWDSQQGGCAPGAAVGQVQSLEESAAHSVSAQVPLTWWERSGRAGGCETEVSGCCGWALISHWGAGNVCQGLCNTNSTNLEFYDTFQSPACRL